MGWSFVFDGRSGADPVAWPRRDGNHPWPAGRSPPFPSLPEARYASGMGDQIAYTDFEKVDIRVGTIIDAQPFPEARKPAIKLWVDFGAVIGVKRSSAQLTVHYPPDRLIGRQVLAVVNFAPRQIGPFVSEVLVLGAPDENGAVVLLRPDLKVPDGGRMF
jgi:tRNA-binding protein